MINIKCNSFVFRQTRTSEFSHWERAPYMIRKVGLTPGSTELEQLTTEHWGAKVAGYRDGVWLVPVPPAGFYSGIADLAGKLASANHTVAGAVMRFAARRDGEEPFMSVTVRAPKLAAEQVNIVVYGHDVLGADANTDADFEIVSINALPFTGPEFPQPVAMMRNQLILPGGTRAEYTARQFAESIRFWSQYAMVEPGEHHNEYGYTC